MPTYVAASVFEPPTPVYINCLLKGTLVRNYEGDWQPIESFKVGDKVLTHTGIISEVVKISYDSFDWEETSTIQSKRMFKIPAGKFGATSNTYLSYYHKIYIPSDEGEASWKVAASAKISRARKEEVCATDSLVELYHLCLEDISHSLVVNGGVVVESWSGKPPPVVPSPPLFSV